MAKAKTNEMVKLPTAVPQMDDGIGASHPLVKQAGRIQIKTQADLTKAGEALASVKGLLNEIETTFGPGQKALNAAVLEFRKGRKKHEEPLLDAERILKTKIGQFHADQEAKARLEAQTQRQAEIKQARAEGDRETLRELKQAPVVVDRAELPKTETVQFRDNWVPEITDPMLVPRQFLMLDMVAINAHVRKHKDDKANQIPGVKAVNKRIVASV